MNKSNLSENLNPASFNNEIIEDQEDNIVKQIRDKKGYTQLRLATELETTRSTVNNWERYARNPKYDHAQKLYSMAQEVGLNTTLEKILTLSKTQH